MPDSYGNPTINEILERLKTILTGVSGDGGTVTEIYPYVPMTVPMANFPFIYLHVDPSSGGFHAEGKPRFSWKVNVTLALKSIEADRVPEDVVQSCYSYILPIVTALAAHLKLGQANSALIDGSITDWMIFPPRVMDLGGVNMVAIVVQLTIQQFVRVPVGI